MPAAARSAIALPLVVLAVLAVRRPAAAQDLPNTVPSTTPVASGAVETSIIGGLSLAIGVALYVTPDPTPGGSPSSWRGGILFDDAGRSALRAPTESGREAAATISDWLMTSTMVNAAVVDAFAVPLARGDAGLAWQATSAYSLALGLTLTLGDLFKDGVGRARPYTADCAQDPSPRCATADAYASFYSLHTAVAFTSAGFSCAMHLSRSLYADGAADAVACGSSLAVAAATGLLRVVADRHYLSDVIAGAAIGMAVGWVIPLLLVPSRTSAPRTETTEGVAMVMPLFSPGAGGRLSTGTFGVSASGTF